MFDKLGTPVQGTDVQAGIGTKTILAAAGAANRYRIFKVIINIYAHQDTGVVSVSDGTTVFIPTFLAKDGNGSSFVFDFGQDGWISAKNATISLIIATAAVSAGCTVIGRKIGGNS